jgi:hypothetical protein
MKNKENIINHEELEEHEKSINILKGNVLGFQ